MIRHVVIRRTRQSPLLEVFRRCMTSRSKVYLLSLSQDQDGIKGGRIIDVVGEVPQDSDNFGSRYRVQALKRGSHQTLARLVAKIFLKLTLVGSSKIKTSGAATSSTPILTLLLSPPLTPRLSPSPILTSATSTRPRSLMTLKTRSCLALSETDSGSRRRAAKSKVSRTVEVGFRTSSCARRGIYLVSAPA
jgi:hypothetical protein